MALEVEELRAAACVIALLVQCKHKRELGAILVRLPYDASQAKPLTVSQMTAGCMGGGDDRPRRA